MISQQLRLPTGGYQGLGSANSSKLVASRLEHREPRPFDGTQPFPLQP